LAALKSRSWFRTAGALALAGLFGMAGSPAAPAADTAAANAPAGGTVQAARVEARSADLLAVGTVRGPRMTIHLSRIIDNAPVPNAAVTVVLRGTAHPATAETDGSYSLETPDLSLPGPAAVQFRIVQGDISRELNGILQMPDAAGAAEDKNGARQLGWWVLNFAVCVGALWLWRRRKADKSLS
jgi:cobalt-zinc-cadmium efflux system membrane fusion protein